MVACNQVVYFAVHRLQNALREGRTQDVKLLLLRCVHELSRPQRENLPLDVRDIVREKYSALEEKRKM